MSSLLSCLAGAVRLKAGSQGSALSRKAVWLAGLVVFGVLLLPAMASAAVCTNTYKGLAEGEWQIAANWSAEHVPTSSDVACVGASETVKVTEGTNHAGVLQDEGTVVVSGGSLELASALEASSAATLSVLGGSLITVGEVVVSGSFTGGGFATLKGAGSVVIASGGNGSVAAAGSAGLTLEEGTLRNEGTFTIGEKSGLQGIGKAQLVNTGTLILNGEGAGSGHALIAGTGEASLKNTGVVEKTEGSATTMQVEFAVDNEGKVSVTAGKLEFTEGGVSGEKAVGSWSTSGAETEIVFNANGPTFALGATVPLTGSFEVANSTVSAGKIEGAAASVTISGAGLAGQGMLDVTGASASTLQNLTTTDREGRAGGILEGSGEVDITGSLTGGGFGTLKGSGTTVIEPGATGTVVAGANGLTLYERTLLDEGTFTIGLESGLQGIHKAELLNTGTLVVNGEPEGTGHGLLAGMGEAKVLNLGLLEKTEGTGTTPIEFGYENFGTVVEETGKFKIFYPLSVEGSSQYGGRNRIGVWPGTSEMW